MDFLTILTCLLFLMPATSSSQYLGNNLLTHRKIFPKQEVNTSYAVFFDAGSTGSRVHVFHFDQNLDLLRIGNDLEFYDKVTPGLSAYADNPEKAAESLIPLLEEAESVVPVELRPKTPVRLGATGLTFLDEDAAESILQAVRDMIKSRSSLNVQSDAVAVINGTQQGSYLWVATNYLLGKLGKKHSKTVGVIDLGGSSVQVAYAVTKYQARNAPIAPEGQDPYITKLFLKRKQYFLYVHSYLGYGKEASRGEILKVTGDSYSPCILAGFDGTYTYAGVEYKASGSPSGSSFDECREIVVEALKVNATCPHENCTFGGIWDGGNGSGQRILYVASAFYYVAIESGIADPSKPNSQVRPLDFAIAAKRACETTLEDAKSAYPLIAEENLPYVCLDLTYQYTLLVDGFGQDPLKEITVVNQIEYQDSLVEAAWPLGNAIVTVSALPKSEKLMYSI